MESKGRKILYKNYIANFDRLGGKTTVYGLNIETSRERRYAVIVNQI